MSVLRVKPLDVILKDTESSEHSLKRVLGAGDLIMLAIGAVIGAGIFGAIGTAAAGQVGPNGEVIRYGAGPALIRYLVRRLRRILPQGTLILVCYWNEEGNKAATKAMLETAEADAYATTLPEAVELCVKAAKGELKRDKAEETEAASAPDQPSGDKPKARAPKRKPQSAAA